jgi:hypothetical protein
MPSIDSLPVFKSEGLVYDLYPDRLIANLDDDRVLAAIGSFAINGRELMDQFSPTDQLFGGAMSRVYRLGSICCKYSSDFTPKNKFLKPEDLSLQFQFLDHLQTVVNSYELTVPDQIAVFKNKDGEYLKLESYIPDHLTLSKFRNKLNPEDKSAFLYEIARRVKSLRNTSPFLAIGLNDLIDDNAQYPNPSNILVPDTPDLDFYGQPFVILDQPSSEIHLNRLRALRSYLKLNRKA